jgi:hypothetical protein
MRDFYLASYLRLKVSTMTHLPTVLDAACDFGLLSEITAFPHALILNQ